MVARFLDLVEDFVADDEERDRAGAPGYGGIFVVHRLADPPSGLVAEADGNR